WFATTSRPEPQRGLTQPPAAVLADRGDSPPPSSGAPKGRNRAARGTAPGESSLLPPEPQRGAIEEPRAITSAGLPSTSGPHFFAGPTRSHTRTVLSAPADASRVPSSRKTTPSAQAVCPSRALRNAPVAGFHSRRLRSLLADARAALPGW